MVPSGPPNDDDDDDVDGDDDDDYQVWGLCAVRRQGW